MRRLALFAVLGLFGCYELDDLEEVKSHVVWNPDASTFRVETTLVDVGGKLFGCTREVDDCAERVRKATLVPSKEEAAQEGWFDFSPGKDLVISGATDIAIRLDRRGDEVDMLVSYTAPVGSSGANQTGVYVEREGKPGREKPRLVVDLVHGRSVEGAPYTRRARPGFDDEGAAIEYETLLFKPKVHELTVSTKPGVEYERLLTGWPQIEDVLVPAGLLPPAK